MCLPDLRPTIDQRQADSSTIAVSEYSFAIPIALGAGPQIWQLTNTGTQPHLMDLAGVPDGTTFDEVMEFLSSAMTGTPAASTLGFEDIREVYSTPNISAGQTMWIEVDLAPGTYAATCFIPVRASGAPHALMGMVQVFKAG
jgi:hypothetical protein